MRNKLPTEVFTPLSVVSMMIEKTSLIFHKTIYDPACGDGNIVCYVAEQLKNSGLSEEEVINTIFGSDIVQENVDKCRARLISILPNISEDKINAHIRCKNTLLSPDNFTYDLIFMNPPYARDTHKKFLLWSLDHAKEVLSIQPCQFLYKHSSLRKIDIECQQTINKYCTSIDIINPNTIWPLNIFASPVAIFRLLKKKKDNFSPIVVNDLMTNDFYSVYTCNTITKDYTKLKNFTQKLDLFMVSHKSLKDFVESIPSKEWTVSFPRIRGHISRHNNMYSSPDFATIATKNNKPIQKAKDVNKRQNFSFNTEFEANNFLTYLKTDFARTCLYLSKHGIHLDNNELAGIPYLDFNYIYTDDILFDMLGCSNPKIVPKYY